MFKKIAIVGAAGLLTAAVLTQTKAGAILSRQIDKADQYLESQISPEEEVSRIKVEVARLDKDIEKARGSVAEERVEAKLLKTRVAEKRTQVETSRQTVEARGKMLREAGQVKSVKWGSQEVSYDRGKELLQNAVNSHKVLEKEFKSLETMQAVRERTRDLAEEHLQALVTQKADLEAAVTQLEADIKVAKIEQVQSKYQNDGTRLAEIKDSVAKLKKRIEIQRAKLDLAKQYDKSGVENKSVEEIMKELDAPEAPELTVSK